jgi:hypothetical protein
MITPAAKRLKIFAFTEFKKISVSFKVVQKYQFLPK